MFFTEASRYAALLAMLFGFFNILNGVLYLTGYMIPGPSSSPSGRLIDTGIIQMIIGIALGTLAEISLSLRKRVS